MQTYFCEPRVVSGSHDASARVSDNDGDLTADKPPKAAEDSEDFDALRYMLKNRATTGRL